MQQIVCNPNEDNAYAERRLKMRLLTPEIEERLNEVPLYATDGMKQREVLVTFYHLFSRWAWYVVEAEKQDDDWLMFTWCRSGLGPDCDEFGYVTLKQLEEVPDILGFVNKNTMIDNKGNIYK